MGGLFFILPLVAFDIWLTCTTGRKQVAAWRAARNWRDPAIAVLAGVLLSVWLAFFFQYSGGEKLRIRGFPIPVEFFQLDGNTWTRTGPTTFLHQVGVAADILTGLVAPFIPYKVAEFLKAVKAELK